MSIVAISLPSRFGASEESILQFLLEVMEQKPRQQKRIEAPRKACPVVMMIEQQCRPEMFGMAWYTVSRKQI